MSEETAYLRDIAEALRITPVPDFDAMSPLEVDNWLRELRHRYRQNQEHTKELREQYGV
jgi:hypothetical protein